VDYKAQVFINGSYVGSHEGAFAPFEFDVTAVAHNGRNQVLVKVENDYPMQGHVGDDGRKLDGDKVYASTGLGYNDPVLGWHHNPPGMGIYQEVQLEARSTLHINDIFVRPIKDSDTAEVWLEVNNTEAAYRNIPGAAFVVRKKLFSNSLYECRIQTIHGSRTGCGRFSQAYRLGTKEPGHGKRCQLSSFSHSHSCCQDAGIRKHLGCISYN
jgi:hypothetical protein